MKSNLFCMSFVLMVGLFGCSSAGNEPVAEVGLDRIHEAPASLQAHGVSRYASRGDGDNVDLALLSERGEVVGSLTAAKDFTNETLHVTLALPGHDLVLEKSKGDGVIQLNGKTVSLSEAMVELDIAREVLIDEGFLPSPEGPAVAQETQANETFALSSGPENATCSAPLRSGCYRSSNQAWACGQAVPGICLAGYCYESCSCYDDTQWYEWPWTVYVCCSYERCNL
jgi:hypothetical protein